jgi:lipopolysaccharide biosynthesis glycosyltransferase
MSGDHAITIALAADARFCRQLATVIAGIDRSASAQPHTVYVLYDGYDGDLMCRAAQSIRGNLELRWVNAAAAKLNAAILPQWVPPSTLFRLRIADLLPDNVERLIYIDSDTVVRESLEGLWATDLGNRLLGAVRDPIVPWAAAPYGLAWSEFGLSPEMPYFNAGVMLIPLDRWRSEDVCRRAVELVSRHRLTHADQCALNIVAAGDFLPLPPRWNLQAGHLTGDGSLAWITEPAEAIIEARTQPAIVHFNHSNWPRPWEPRSTHPFRAQWFEDLDRTAWAGWRPKSRTAIRVARRIRRAGRVLRHG